MKRRCLVLSLLATVAVLSATGMAAEVPGLGKRLPGKYKLSYKGTLLSLQAVKSYHADGSYESLGTAKVLGIGKALVHRGHWKLEDGYLVYTLTESSTPKEAPIGVPLRFKVVGHDGTKMEYEDEEKEKRYVEQRIGDASK